MKKKSGSREKILLAASDLFHAQGVHATGLDEILSKSGTGKGQFYHFFKNKDDLVHQVLEALFARLKSGQFPVNSELKSWEDLERWFQFFVTVQKTTGCARSCPIATIGADIDDRQIQLRRDACGIFDWIRATLANFFKLMRKRKQLRPRCDPESLADFCLSVMQGGMLLSKIVRDTAPFEHAVQHALGYVKTLRV